MSAGLYYSKLKRAVGPDRLRALEVLARCALDTPTLQRDE